MSNPDRTSSFPSGLSALSLSTAYCMVAICTLNAILVLYLTQQLHVHDQDAYAFFATYSALFYSASLLGGFLGGRFSHRNIACLGGILATLGLLLVATSAQLGSLSLGLSCLIIGSGYFVPNVYCAIGQIYAYGDSKRDSGFTIAYVAMNVGGFVGAAASGFLTHHFGYNSIFILIAGFSLLATLTYRRGLRHCAFHDETPYKRQLAHANTQQQGYLPGLIVAIILLPLLYWLLNHSYFSNILLIVATALALGGILGLSFRETTIVRYKIWIFLLLCFVSIGFWSLYMLAPSALQLFIERNVRRQYFGMTIPTASFYSLNPLFIILIGPLLSVLWLALSKRQMAITAASKFAIGLFLMGLGYLIFIPAIGTANVIGKISAGWVVLTYAFQATAELLIGPIGNAMVGRLAPPKLEGLMMGYFQLNIGVSGAISSYLAFGTTNLSGATNPLLTNPIYRDAFGHYGLVTVLLGIILLLFLRPLNRLIRT